MTSRIRNCKKKKVYHSRSEAKEKAMFYRKNNGIRQMPYNCDVCSNYHLTSSGNIRSFIMDAVTGIAMIGMCAIWCFVIYAFWG